MLQQILPFILVGIGIDDAFVISGAFDATDPSLGFPERMEKAIQRVGVSITLTKVTSLAAFLLGATCAFPSVQYFCYYASTSVSWSVGKVISDDFWNDSFQASGLTDSLPWYAHGGMTWHRMGADTWNPIPKKVLGTIPLKKLRTLPSLPFTQKDLMGPKGTQGTQGTQGLLHLALALDHLLRPTDPGCSTTTCQALGSLPLRCRIQVPPSAKGWGNSEGTTWWSPGSNDSSADRWDVVFAKLRSSKSFFFLGSGGFLKWWSHVVPQNGGVFIMENPIKVDDLEVPLFFGNPEVGTDLSYF